MKETKTFPDEMFNKKKKKKGWHPPPPLDLTSSGFSFPGMISKRYDQVTDQYSPLKPHRKFDSVTSANSL